MAKKSKKENIVEILKAGAHEQIMLEGHKEPVPGMLKIRTATGLYTMPDDDDIWKSIERKQNSLDRYLANKQNYGDDRGRAGVYKDNRTAIDLALLKGRPDYLRVAYRAWTMAQNAPQKIREYVYHNLIVMANRYHADAERFLLKEIQDYTFEVLPPAWRSCMDDPCPELEGVTLQDVVDELTPVYKVGQKLTRRMRGDKEVKVVVTGHEIIHRYGLRSTDVSVNPYYVEYRVRNADDKGRHAYIYNVKSEHLY